MDREVNAYILSKKVASIFEGDRFEIVGVFDSETKAVNYMRSKGRYTHSEELAKDLRECYIATCGGQNEEVYRMKEMTMNEGE